MYALLLGLRCEPLLPLQAAAQLPRPEKTQTLGVLGAEHVTEESHRKRQEVTVTVTVAVAAARTITVTVTSSHQESKVLPVVMIMQVGHVVASVNDAAMMMALMMALMMPLMMQNFNVPFKQTRSPKQYCKAPCRLLMGRLPWARASRTRLRPCG